MEGRVTGTWKLVVQWCCKVGGRHCGHGVIWVECAVVYMLGCSDQEVEAGR